ncbi:hypothetical protein Deipe_2860 [Deinococcus peraridilitoris DSM 19664]|uniref:Metal-dependent phosphohydrolase 7TM extracellular domain-containing protein n=2 Tax=Deinococcus TaxID=1298 RepID=L0A349_DEIPD|nr:hypothetical protein Deipe_2860 [Deinococcus peraridilitoris DSM 19664]
MALVLGLAGYFLVWRPAQAFLQNFNAFTVPFTGQPNQNASSNQNPPPQSSVPPARDEVRLTSAQVQQFVRVRRSVREALGQDFERLQNTYQEFAAGQPPGTLEILGVLRDAGGFIGRARRAQQDALTREELSEGQYATIRREVNGALGVPELDLGAAARALQSGQLPSFNQVVRPPNARNASVLQPYLPELRSTAALGLIGL